MVNSRQHSISRVFAGDDKGLELVLLGAVKTGFKNGQVLDSPFACHVTVDASSAESGDPRLKFMEVFAVSRVFAWNLCFISVLGIDLICTGRIRLLSPLRWRINSPVSEGCVLLGGAGHPTKLGLVVYTVRKGGCTHNARGYSIRHASVLPASIPLHGRANVGPGCGIAIITKAGR